MSIGLIGTPTTNSSGTGGAVTSINCDLPTSAPRLIGDLGIWAIAGNNITAPSSGPAGWTLLSSGTTTALYVVVYYRFLDGTEITTQTSGTLSSARAATCMMLFRGVTSQNEVALNSANGTTVQTVNPITPITIGAMIVSVAARIHSSGVTPGTQSSNMSGNIVDSSTNAAAAANPGVALGFFWPWESGAFTPVWANSAATSRTSTNRFAMKPHRNPRVQVFRTMPVMQAV